MPPRISGPQGLKSMTLCLRPTPSTIPATPSLQPLIQKATLTQRERDKLRQMKIDPYRWQLAQNRRNANLQRRAELADQRVTSWGDPVQGIVTPFVESFDSGGQAAESQVKRDDDGNPLEQPHELPTSKHILNYQLSQAELEEAIEASYQLTKPVPGISGTAVLDPEMAKMTADPEAHMARHRKAVEALRRITTLENGSSRDRRHANTRRIVETFGRHNTDQTVRQKALAFGQEERFEKIRGGPDTGSSEVQIAILTAKIRALSKMLAGPKGNKDKHNKKNLRLLLHRRQKLLKYMERKERGSGRWEHMIETLGLSPATWKGEIVVR
ncbi:hypothetical protein M406DRAFT_60687 [Cryphonectria parasitica EP155]|uniref:Ribosomal protein S15 n=1 Tax=Cryphonectria parasitica (strain ATCC 38755 / EP155) TaxID=660469 RepID=A0A9P4Y4K7_CRYP1|nr:uncharacterized protein M406DRAFT_60687 [Cryphonectria parasitica EP155]KAF3766257.1 hypothetical protein M406DRAFT_60687 [Cryphonectria parasitica EP155]